MGDWTLYEWVQLVILVTGVVVATIGVTIALLAWLRPRHTKNDSSREIKRFESYQGKEFHVIHATNGVPTLPQLIEDMDLDSKELGVARTSI